MECCNLRYIGKNPIDLRTDEVTTVNQEQKIVVKDVAINGNVKDLVKDRGIFNSKSLDGTDYNTLTKQGVYAVPLSGSTNGPGYAAKVLVYSVFGSQMVTQVAIDVGSVAIKCRYKSDTADWTPWETVIFNTDTATTSKAGIVRLNNTVTSTSTTQAATANAVKMAYDKAIEASESTGRSETADKLTTARTIQTNLASTAAGSFDGSKNITIGVSGTLPTANGGTGRTDGKAPSLVTARTIGITGVVTGTATAFDGTKNITIDTTKLNLEDAGVTGELPTSHGGTGRTDGKAVGLVTKRTIDGVYFDGTANITHFGSCSTAAATAAKVVSVPNFVLDTGAEVTVRFTVTNTAASPTLNVNNTGAKAIVYRNAAISAGYLAANRVYKFVYDGTNYELIGDIDTNTTYSAASTSKAGIVQLNNTVTSASTTQAATANAVKLAYDKAVEASESTGRSETADKLNTARTIGIGGVVTGTATAFDGSKNITIDTTKLNLEDAGVTGELPTSHGGTGRTDGKAVGLVTKRTIDGVYFDGTANIAHFGSCSTAAATAAKVVAVPNFVLATGAEVTVQFTVTNTAASPTLNVNNTGAKAIVYRNAAISAGYLAANRVYKFVYDGTNYELIGDVNTDTNTDTKVTQTVTTTDAEYPLLISTDANKTSSSTTTARFASAVTLNPSTKKISCSGISGKITGVNYVNSAKDGGSLIDIPGLTTGGYQPIFKTKSTNGAFVMSGYQAYLGMHYITDENIEAGTNTVTQSLKFEESGLLTSSGGFKGSLSGNASSATKLASKRTIDGVSFDGSANITHFGKCSTEAGTAAKVVSVANFVLATGAEVTVQFTVTNTATSPTLNVNNTGAKAIVYRNTAISAGYLAANRVYKFVYDGTNYELIGDIDTNTRYTAASATPKAPGTAAVGTSSKYAREDHVHPLQTTVSGNAGSASKLATARTIGITGVVTGTATAFDGTKNISIDATKLNIEDTGITGELPIAHGGTGRTDGKAVALVTARTISLTGVVTGSASFDGSKNISITTKSDGIGGNIPIGGIIAFSGTFGGTNDRFPIPLGSSTPDTNWCLCDGTTTNGKTVPDLRGRMILGASTSHAAGTKGGSETHTHSISGTVGAHTLTVAQIPSHNHTFTSSKGDKDFNNGGGNTWWGWNSNRTTTTTAVGSTQSHTHNFSNTSTTKETLLPPYYALSYIMRIS